MKTIYKYEIPFEDDFYFSLPKDAEILSYQTDNKNGGIHIWAKVDTEKPLETRRFALVGTGNPIEFDNGIYIGTAQQGYFVWHLFEIKTEPPKED